MTTSARVADIKRHAAGLAILVIVIAMTLSFALMVAVLAGVCGASDFRQGIAFGIVAIGTLPLLFKLVDVAEMA